MLSSVLLLRYASQESNRMAQYELFQEAERTEVGAELFQQNCTRCHGTNAEGTTLAPCLRCDEFFNERAAAMGWVGSLEDYITYTISNGRTVSSRPEEYPGGGDPAMPIWAEQYGGPLREDQIQAITTFLMNYEDYALGVLATPVPLEPLSSMADDPIARGRFVFLSNDCRDCHAISGLSVADDCPSLDGISQRAAMRVEGYSAEEYIRESILFPAAFKVEVEKDVVMPPNFGEKLSPQQIDDLVIFLLSLEE